MFRRLSSCSWSCVLTCFFNLMLPLGNLKGGFRSAYYLGKVCFESAACFKFLPVISSFLSACRGVGYGGLGHAMCHPEGQNQSLMRCQCAFSGKSCTLAHLKATASALPFYLSLWEVLALHLCH
jgi:hypothetical protein